MTFPCSWTPGGEFIGGVVHNSPIGEATVTLAYQQVDALHPTGHAGIDLVCEPVAGDTTDGHPIVLLVDGTVIDKGFTSVMGHYIMLAHGDLRHPGTLASLYLHSPRPSDFNIGDTVSAGSVLNVVDNTGLSTGPHLHWGMYAVGIDLSLHLIDPLSVFGVDSLAPPAAPPSVPVVPSQGTTDVPPRVLRVMDIATGDIAIEVAKANINNGKATVQLVDTGDDNQVGVLVTITKADLLAAYPAGL